MMEEFRRARRRAIQDPVQVVDTMTDTVIGQLSNLSETGMLLIATTPLVEDGLYQLRFNLRGAPHQNGYSNSAPIEVGAHLLWQDDTSTPGQTWSGFRFITMLESELQQLRHWLESGHGKPI
ncbi:PilZ domain-containing protein [Lysobacter sp. MMG2]|uniref:PilZ domain-containing protein n=2 Tax=unclassified Lysobacter TaxID=2635362 RepID=UPI001C24E057|nr:PilZ domain-containing protein [Lysobacter sp. MMG2]MBU8976856.1 PilZ domain-containing protein [Lysobacter sp. MMG2]